MINVDFTRPIVAPDNQPYRDAHGQPVTLGQAAVQLLSAYVAPNVDEARLAVSLATQVARNDPLVSVMEPGVRVFEQAVKANDAHLPAAVLGHLAHCLGVKGG
jgi:hypothetical protein